jgi:hypothetical protein
MDCFLMDLVYLRSAMAMDGEDLRKCIDRQVENMLLLQDNDTILVCINNTNGE